MINQSLFIEGNMDSVLKTLEHQRNSMHNSLFIVSVSIVNIKPDYWSLTIISDSTRDASGENRFKNIK